MNNKIIVCSTARSDFGLLENIIKHLKEYVEVSILPIGAHMTHDGENAFYEILEFGKKYSVNIHSSSVRIETSGDNWTSKSTVVMIDIVSKILSEQEPDLILILGDRWELFSVTIPALHQKIPIAHISGGEITEGVIDDNIRHATTKLSHIHFAATKEYAKNISSMGEEDWRIAVTGEPGLLEEDISSNQASINKTSQEDRIKTTDKIILVTYHPTRHLNENELKRALNEIKKAMIASVEYKFIITGPGLEEGANLIRKTFRELSKDFSHISYFEHLGRLRYHNLVKRCFAVLGNSSSGIVEVPSLNKPCINIGVRQKGRLCSDAVLHVSEDFDEIVKAIALVEDQDFIKKVENSINPYDPFRDGQNSWRIASGCINALKIKRSVLIEKKFKTCIIEDQWNSLND